MLAGINQLSGGPILKRTRSATQTRASFEERYLKPLCSECGSGSEACQATTNDED